MGDVWPWWCCENGVGESGRQTPHSGRWILHVLVDSPTMTLRALVRQDLDKRMCLGHRQTSQNSGGAMISQRGIVCETLQGAGEKWPQTWMYAAVLTMRFTSTLVINWSIHVMLTDSTMPMVLPQISQPHVTDPIKAEQYRCELAICAWGAPIGPEFRCSAQCCGSLRILVQISSIFHSVVMGGYQTRFKSRERWGWDGCGRRSWAIMRSLKSTRCVAKYNTRKSRDVTRCNFHPKVGYY